MRELQHSRSFWHVLARVWSAIAFFHPLVQERRQEWEHALVTLISQAEAVAYEPVFSVNQRAILNALLLTLDDSATRLTSRSEEPVRPARQPTITQKVLHDNIIYVRVRDWFAFRITPGYFEEWEEAIRSLTTTIEAVIQSAAPSLILDFRETTGDQSDQNAEACYITGRMRSELIARLFTEPVSLPSLARLQHVGYHDPLASGPDLGGYGAEWVSQATGESITPATTAFSGRVVVLTAHDTNALLEPVLVLLQHSGRAYCIGDQSYAYHAFDHILPLTDEHNLQLRRYTLMYNGHPARYRPNLQSDDPLAAALSFLTDAAQRQPTSSLPRPSRGHLYTEEFPARPQRIFAAIKLWSAMRTFYAYRDHLADWDAVLIPAIQQAADTETREQFFAALQNLSSRNKGGHNFVLFTSEGRIHFASRPCGFAPGIRLARINGNVTIIGPIEMNTQLQPGDRLQAINGETIQDREQRLRSLCDHYPAAAIDHYLLQALLDSPKDTLIRIQVRSIQGALREVEMVADHPVQFVTEPVAVTALPAWGLLSNNFTAIGYLDTSRIDIKHIDQALADLTSAQALIVDIRRYPTLSADALKRFRHHPVPVQKTMRPIVIAPEEPVFGWLESRFYDTDEISPVETPDRRPLAALIGPGTISLGEDWVYQLLIGCRATLVGGVTAGGVGSNAFVLLPGSGRASFSGSHLTKAALDHDIEGNGFQPHIYVQQALDDTFDTIVSAAAQMLLQKLHNTR